MTEIIQKKLSESKSARWLVLVLVSLTMLCSYFLADAMAPLKSMLEQQLHWTSTDYGIFTSGYGWFNVFLLMLVFAGIILDKMGTRFTGVLAIIIMLIGAFIKYWAINSTTLGDIVNIHIGSWELFETKRQVLYAGLGFAIFGMGIEMFGITANKAIVRWFKGKELALAIGLNTSTGRIGTGLAMIAPIPLAKWMGTPTTPMVSAPILMAMLMIVIGLMAFLLFNVMDVKLDKEEAKHNTAEVAEDFRFSDILRIAKISGFWYITILCVLFYSAVFPFIKYATELIMQKYGVSDNFAGAIPAMLPVGALFLTPVFGSIYDHKGKGASIMMIGSILLVVVFLLFAIPTLNSLPVAIGLIVILGIAFSLVPSALWPSVTKVVPHSLLGTAYAMIFWVQNWGLMGVPLLIGNVLDKYCKIGEHTVIEQGVSYTVVEYNYTIPMLIFAGFGVLAIFFSYMLKREDRIKQYGLELPNIKK
ncbi:MAG: MFS transporter [Bacteroidales bacterium]|nr:MFS transporter [Bacteroidales bacterium]